MKRVIRVRLTFTMLFAILVLALSYKPAQAAEAPNQFMTTNTTVNAFYAVMGAYDFNLYNRTTGWVLNGFYTKQEGKWSKNWLTAKLSPGKFSRMHWASSSDSGACVVPFKATWDDYDKPETYSLDWCKGIKNVYLKDNTFTVDYK